MIDFRTEPARYRHWTLTVDGRVATLALDVQEDGGLKPGYALKLNSYDLGVDIELHDALQRVRFEHPQVGAVILASRKDRVFCAGANIGMLSQASHGEKVNFCKFTNETRNAMEDSSAHGLAFVAAVNGACAGGGYELALACDTIVLADDGSSAVSLPELPLLAVLPGTGGLTRLIDKRKVRRDLADLFCTTEEGVRGKRALEWGLVDALVPRTRLEAAAREHAEALAARSSRPAAGQGVALTPLDRTIDGDTIMYAHLTVTVNRALRSAELLVTGPTTAPPADAAAIHAAGAGFWPLALARALDDAILHLRANEPEIGAWVFRSAGDADLVASYDTSLAAYADDWFVRETRLFLKRVLKRIDVSSRSLVALIEPGSCFTGTLLELALASDRSYMLLGQRDGDNQAPASIRLTAANFGGYEMPNGLTRLASRFLGAPERVDAARALIGQALDAETAAQAGLVTLTPDDIDWDDEVRLALEARASFSPDALTGMEASLRFGGPETLETKIFGRLSAWQNWIFQRPNAVGEAGALKRYGSGQRADLDKSRV
ncbi:MAG: benzoyl-CoA-dihydrodiol lyase [Alphaproteobacteria bacterium]|nr:benzoyl-CoA-dihydrodiol lyase [Alphaproteobacteria bacterium]